MSRLLLLLPLGLIAAPLFAAATPPTTKSDAPPTAELKTLMVDRGALLFAEDFTPETVKKNWYTGKGEWKFDDNAIGAAGKPEDNHHPYMGHGIKLPNDVVIQVAVKFETADTIFFGLDDKEHVARWFLSPENFKLVRMSGIGPTTKGENIDELHLKLERNRWYTVVWELHGDETLAHIDEQFICYGSAQGLDAPKGQVQLMTLGDHKWGWFAHLKIWEATAKADWEKKKKPQILDYLKKRK